MALCTDCNQPPPQDVALQAIKQRAKQAAIEANEAMAIYKEGGEYRYISAEYARTNGYPAFCVVSKYS